MAPTPDEAAALVGLQALRACARVADATLSEVAPGLTVSQHRALTLLAEGGPTRATALARALGSNPSTTTRLVDRLVRDGLARREPSQTDRRVVELVATRQGASMVTKVRERRLAVLRRAINACALQHTDDLIDALAAFATGLDAAAGQPLEVTP